MICIRLVNILHLKAKAMSLYGSYCCLLWFDPEPLVSCAEEDCIQWLPDKGQRSNQRSGWHLIQWSCPQLFRLDNKKPEKSFFSRLCTLEHYCCCSTFLCRAATTCFIIYSRFSSPEPDRTASGSGPSPLIISGKEMFDAMKWMFTAVKKKYSYQ